MLLLGVNQKSEFCDKIKEILEGKNKDSQTNLQELRKKASDKIKTNQEYNKEQYNKRHKIPHKYRIGDYVMIRNVVNEPGINKKFLPKYKGPYKVIHVLDNDRYIIQDIEGIQMSRTPYKGLSPSFNMKPYLNCFDKK